MRRLRFVGRPTPQGYRFALSLTRRPDGMYRLVFLATDWRGNFRQLYPPIYRWLTRSVASVAKRFGVTQEAIRGATSRLAAGGQSSAMFMLETIGDSSRLHLAGDRVQ